MPKYQHDSAALAGAALAVAIAIYTQTGPFQFSSLIVGVTILFLVYGYEIDRTRSRMQSLALSCISGLASILVFGTIVELIRTDKIINGHLGAMNTPSNVTEIDVVLIWIIVAGVVFWVDRRNQARLLKV